MAVLVVVVPTPHAGAAATPPSCHTGRTMAASAQVRVFGFALDRSRPESFSHYYRAYACYLPTRKVRRLGTFATSNPHVLGTFGVYNFVVRGRLVAFDDVYCDREDACRGRGIVVMDVRTGRERTGSRTKRLNLLITDLVLKPNASVAWIRERVDGSVEVRKRDAGGDALLESGTDIERGSLALAGGTIYWTRAGTPRSAPLD
jgi:hypothetical protein